MKRMLRVRYFVAWVLLLPLLVGRAAFSALAAQPAALQTISAYRDIPGVTQAEIAAVEALRAQYDGFTYGMNLSAETFIDQHGEISGFSVLVAEWLTRLFDIPVTVRIIEWDALLKGLDDHSLSFTGEMTVTPERLGKYRMTDTIAERTVKIFYRGHTEREHLSAMGRPLRYGFLRGATTEEDVRRASNLTFDTVYVSTHAEAAEMLRAGTIDAFFEEGPSEAAFESYPFVLSETFFPLIYSPVSLSTGDPALAPIISIVNKYLAAGGGAHLTDLYREGTSLYQQHKFRASLTPDEASYIAALQKRVQAVRYAAEYDNYPSSFYNETEDAFQGIAIDVLDAVGKVTGLAFEPANDPGESREALLALLEAGQAALITEMVPTGALEGRFLWSENAYATDAYTLISKAETPNIDVSEVSYANVGLVRDSIHAELFEKWFPGNTHARYYADEDAAFDALTAGQVDFIMATQNMLLSLTHFLEQPGYKANIVFGRSYDSLFGFGTDQALLRSVVDKALRLLDTERIRDQWIYRVFDYQGAMAKAQIPFLFAIASVLTLGLIAVTLLLQRIRRMNKNLTVTVRQRTWELEQQTQRAQAASRSKSDFLSRMSHEIRTPLNIIMGMSRIAKQSEGLPEKTRFSLKEIDAASNHLLGIVNDVLDMSKIESGKFEIVAEPFLLREALDEVTQMILPRARDKQIHFAAEHQCAPSLALIGDKLRLKQVLINLLGNAVKFTPNEGAVRCLTRVTGRTDAEITVSFTVEDTGIGMNEQQLSKLFSPFEQADTHIAARFGGTGLGLSISQSLVRQMGGLITVQSEPGGGSAFRFILTFQKADAASDDAPDETGALPRLDGRRVLIVEDVELNRLILSELLAETGAAFETAEDGAQAVEMFEQSPPNWYHLVFMDIQMPNMNGYDATAAIRKLPRPDARTVPIFAMTANAYREDVEKALLSGMNGHLSKPINLAAMARVLSAYAGEER